jgi:hypothetical protein
MRAAIAIVILLVGNASADEPKPTPSPVPQTAPGVKPAEPPKPADPPQPVDKPTDKPTDKPASTGNAFDTYTGANTRGRELFERGKQLLREGNQTAACSDFADAFKQEEATSTQLSLARCRENEGKYGEARRIFLDAAQRSRMSGLEDRAKLASDAAAALEPRLATVVIRLATPIAPGTVVTVNDRIVDTAPEVRELVDPGTVVVKARGPTGVTSTKSFRIFVGNTFKADVPTLQERSGGRQPLWIAVSAIAVGGGAIALGAGSGAVQLIGGAAVAGGVALFLLAPRQRTMAVPMVIVNDSGGGIALGGRF